MAQAEQRASTMKVRGAIIVPYYNAIANAADTVGLG